MGALIKIQTRHPLKVRAVVAGTDRLNHSCPLQITPGIGRLSVSSPLLSPHLPNVQKLHNTFPQSASGPPSQMETTFLLAFVKLN